MLYNFTGNRLDEDRNIFYNMEINEEKESDYSFTFLFFWRLQVTYSGAILEVCMRKLVFYPEIVGFIEEEKEKFPSVKVQYIFNSPPKLIMLDEDGEHKETIR